MKILFVNPTADLYGASRVLLRLLVSLDPSSYQSLVILPEEGPLAVALRQHNISVRIVPYVSIIRRRVLRTWRLVPFIVSIIPSILRLWWIMRQYQTQIVYSNTGVVFTPAVAAWLARKPHVWHLHEMFAEEFPRLWRYFGPFILHTSAAVLCVSTPIAQQFSPRPKKVQVVYNGLDTDDFRATPAAVQEWHRRFCTSTTTRLIGVIGRISPRKGQDVFLQASAILKAEGYDELKYLIIGDAFAGNEYLEDDLRKFVSTHGLAKDVIFSGFVEDPAPLVGALDVLVLPSILPEAFPTIVLEAMAMGVPVIATCVGGTVEQIEDKVTGLLIPPSSPDAIAQAIKLLLDNPELSAKLGAAGRQQIDDRFSLLEMRLKLESTFENLIRQHE